MMSNQHIKAHITFYYITIFHRKHIGSVGIGIGELAYKDQWPIHEESSGPHAR